MSNYDTSIPFIDAGGYLEYYVPRTKTDIPLAYLYGLDWIKKYPNK